MTRDDVYAIVLSSLDEVAPGAGSDRVDPDADLREALDLDSMDVLNLIASIAEQTGIDIPDRDVGALKTMEDLVDRVMQGV